jgi:hypothetical protein
VGGNRHKLDAAEGLHDAQLESGAACTSSNGDVGRDGPGLVKK